jgi:F420H(2)-dependent quinone reductase
MTLLSGDYVPSAQQWVRDQVAEYEESGGARANTLRGGPDPIVVITSVGRKTGSLRKNPLMRVERDGKYLAVASLGGSPTNPEWYYNFLANPVVQLQDGPEPRLYRARLLSGEEREEWWAYAVQTGPFDVRPVPAPHRAPDPDLPARRGLSPGTSGSGRWYARNPPATCAP